MKLDALEMYLQLRADTEPPPIYHRWCFLTCMSAFMARKVWFPFGDSNINTNMFTMLIGDPGARKTTAINQAVSLFSAAGYNTLAARRTSKEKFLQDLEGKYDEDEEYDRKAGGRKNGKKHKIVEVDLEDVMIDEDENAPEDRSPKHVLVAADEFNNFMGNGNIEFLSLLGELWDWDNTAIPYTYRLKNSRSVAIWQPTVSILAGNTPENFRLTFPEEALGQGYMSRQLLVYGERTGIKISFPKPADDALKLRILEMLTKSQMLEGPMKITNGAREMLDKLYRTWQDLDDRRFKAYSNRRYTHLIKLSMIYACIRQRVVIIEEDILHANTVLAFTENLMPKAMGELGKSRNSEAAQKIMQALYEARAPMSAQQIWRVVSMDLERMSDLGTVLDGLKQADKLQVIAGDDGGKKVAYLPKLSSIKRHVMYVDLDYLRGKEMK